MVRQRSAKPPFSGSNPDAAFFYCPKISPDIVFSKRIEYFMELEANYNIMLSNVILHNSKENWL